MDELIEWFETELPVPDITLGDVVVNPFLVIHELVEIDQVLKMGLQITKDVISRNPEKVDDAHLRATRVELQIARSIGAVEHFRKRIRSIEEWCVSETLSESRKADYRQLLAEAREHLSFLEDGHPSSAARERFAR